MIRMSWLAASLIALAACKTTTGGSDLLSGPAGGPGNWTCLELKTQFEQKKADLVAAIAAYQASKTQLGIPDTPAAATGSATPATTPATTGASLTDGDDDGASTATPDGSAASDGSDPTEALFPTLATDPSALTVPPQTVLAELGPAADDFNPAPPPDESATALRLDDAQPAVQTTIGQGDDAMPALPPEFRKFHDQYENAYGVAGRDPTGCDDLYSQYGQSTSTQILEQCRYVATLNNFLVNTMAEYNLGRNGECRSGIAATQTRQKSTIFPYCMNRCRFGLDTCTKCEFTVGVLPSYYICGDEQDARQAVAQHCSSSTALCTGTVPSKCTTAVFNDIALGTTSMKTSDTSATIDLNLNTQFSVEANIGASVKAHRSTNLDVSLVTHLVLKNGHGAPIMTVNGGNPATTYSCSVQVSAAVVRNTGVDVGAGFDLVVAKGNATVGAGVSLGAATSYNSVSADIPAGGLTLTDMLEGCKRFATDWGTNDLPALLTQNIAFKTVASVFMGATKSMFEQDVSGTNTYCMTDRRHGYLSSGPVQYKIPKVWWELTDNTVNFKYRYSGSWFTYDSPVFGFTKDHLGADRYAKLRQQVFNGSVSIDDIRALIGTAYDYNGWVKQCQEGRF